MESESQLDMRLNNPDPYLHFSFMGFILYGWFGWLLNPIIGILFSPLFFLKYSIICSSFEKGKIYTRKKIYLMHRTGLGYKVQGPYKKPNPFIKIVFIAVIVIIIQSNYIDGNEPTKKLIKEDSKLAESFN